MLVCQRRFSRVRKAIIGAMPTVPAPPPIPRLPPEWQDWLAGNVVRGCTDADLLADREISLGFVFAEPNMALVHDLLSADGCAQPIALAAGKLSRSQVVDRAAGCRAGYAGQRTVRRSARCNLEHAGTPVVG